MERLDLVDHGDWIAKEAFRALLSDATPLTIPVLTTRLGAPEDAVRVSLTDLAAAGRAELDADTLLGLYGLTLKPTQHRLTLRGAVYFTWCAWDSVGIPAALGESALVESQCASCHQSIRLTITDGVPPQLPVVVSWLSERCDSIRDQFCPTINFYCDGMHYESARNDGDAPDEALDMERAAEMGRVHWGWAR